MLLPLMVALSLFESMCVPCHGRTGQGDGPAAALFNPRPANLTQPDTFKLGSSPEALTRTLKYGLPGTGMPAFGALSEAERSALVEHIRSLASTTPPKKVSADPLWPREGVVACGPKQAKAAPALGRLEAQACARCHPKIAEEWGGSVHARAMGPGVVGQYHQRPALRGRCDRCHAPLVAQRGSDSKSVALAHEGVTCAACHLRAGEKITGPRALRARKGAIGARAKRVARLGRSDMCVRCHNLPLAAAVGGRPLLNTWREWAASPYLPAGIQCQHCHMPGGDHKMLGVHDAQTVAQAVRMGIPALAINQGWVRARIEVKNVGAGHHFPTTATPRAVLRVRQLGDSGAILGTEALWAIGRTVRLESGAWVEVADTRIPAGGAKGWCYEQPLRAGARRLEVSLHMFPDWFYTTVYRGALDRGIAGQARVDLAAALSAGEAAGFLVDFVRLPLPATPPHLTPPSAGGSGPIGWPTCGARPQAHAAQSAAPPPPFDRESSP